MKNAKTSPVAWVPTAYFAMGLPFVVVNMVSVLMFEGMGVDNASITFWTSLILLPSNRCGAPSLSCSAPRSSMSSLHSCLRVLHSVLRRCR